MPRAQLGLSRTCRAQTVAGLQRALGERVDAIWAGGGDRFHTVQRSVLVGERAETRYVEGPVASAARGSVFLEEAQAAAVLPACLGERVGGDLGRWRRLVPHSPAPLCQAHACTHRKRSNAASTRRPRCVGSTGSRCRARGAHAARASPTSSTCCWAWAQLAPCSAEHTAYPQPRRAGSGSDALVGGSGESAPASRLLWSLTPCARERLQRGERHAAPPSFWQTLGLLVTRPKMASCVVLDFLSRHSHHHDSQLSPPVLGARNESATAVRHSLLFG